MAYSFRKLYADLVTDDLTVCIAYASWLEAAGFSRLYAGLERYDPDGKRTVARAKRAYILPGLEGQRGMFTLGLDLPGGLFELSYEGDDRTYRPTTPVHPAGLTWMIRVPCARGIGRWTGDDSRKELHGTGYADWVELGRWTRRFKMRKLQWGRVHMPEETIVFNAVTFQTGSTWQSIVKISSGSPPVPLQGFDTRWEKRNVQLRLETSDSTYLLRPVRVLHQGPAIDRERFPGRLEHAIFRAITGPNFETRWLSRVSRVDNAAADGWALHEEVTFEAGPEAMHLNDPIFELAAS